MKRRLEIARAFVGWPPIMLFDEPAAGLDPINEGQVLDLILRARDLRRISSLLVTKRLHEISYLAGHRAVEAEGGGVEVREAVGSGQPTYRCCCCTKARSLSSARPTNFSAIRRPPCLT